MTIDGLIAELQVAKNMRGGDAIIYIKDADTGWHLKVTGVQESNNEAGKVLIVPEDYSDYSDQS